ncbi:MAG: M16 family metallopeptidase [Gemmatimonadota bacterium]
MRLHALPLLLTCILAGCSAFRNTERVPVGPPGARPAGTDSAPDSTPAGADDVPGSAAAPRVPIETRVLDNGLRVIVVRNPVVPLVTVELDVNNGAYTQTPEYEGLAHLYEHMLFKANAAIPNQERWLERTRELGIVWNGSTSAERVNYFVTLPRDNLRAGMEFMRDAIRHPLFDQAELERERPVVLGEYDRNESNPAFALSMSVDSLLWGPEYFSRKNVIGNREVIATTTREKMRTIQQRYYVPNNTALVLAGDLETEEAFDLAEEVFGDWPRAPDPFSTYPIPPVPRLAESKAVIVERPVNSVTVTLAWQGPSLARNRAATYAADVLSAALRLPDSGFQKRLVDSGLAFNAGLSYASLAYTGPIRLTAQTAPERVAALLRALEREIAAFDDPGYVTPEQLAAAKKRIAVAEVYAREQPSQFAHALGFWWAVAGLQYYLGYVANVQNVDAQDLASYARTYIQEQPRVTGVLIAPADRERVGLVREGLL